MNRSARSLPAPTGTGTTDLVRLSLRRLALAAIRFYQRHVSPYKGFSCAYRVHTGHASCSTLGYRAVRRFGLRKGWQLIRQRTRRCGVAHHRFGPAVPLPRPMHGQRGICDPGCDLPCDAGGCDLPSGKGLSRVCDVLSCCDCSWPERKKRGRDQDPAVYLPPKVRSRVEPRRKR